MNLRKITKNHATDPEIGFVTKSIPRPYDRATAMPPAWELIDTKRIFFEKKLFVKGLKLKGIDI